MPDKLRFWRGPAEAIIYTSLLLFLIGTVNIFSASFVEAAHSWNDSYFFLKRHLMSFGVGIVVMLLIMLPDYRKLNRLTILSILVTITMLVAVHFLGEKVNGARRWLNIGMQFQPSEVAKLTAILLSASYLGPRIDRGRRISLWSIPVILTAVMSGLIMKQPDMGTAVIVFGLCLILYLLAGLPKPQIYVLLGGAAAGAVYFTYAAAYRAERIAAWLDPWGHQQGIGYQSVQALLAIGSGGFTGTGFGMGASKFYYLPEAHTDFAFAVLSQEMGFIGALVVLILIAVFACYGGQIARRAPDGFGKMLASGATLLVAGQAVSNIAMVSGLLPVIGVPLPFVSYGGTSLISNMLAIGILVSISRQTAKRQEEEAQQPISAEPEPPVPPVRPNRLRLADRIKK